MSATPTFELRYTDRAAINRANSQHSTGPRTEAGKKRSSQNALRHGLTARTPVLASEDQAAYESHCRKFENEYQPATPTETQLVQELADTSWRLNRIPILEADLLDRALRCSPAREQGDSPESPAPNPQSLVPQLAAILELHKHIGIPWEPSDHGFVFSKEQVERHSERLMRQNEARHIACVRFEIPFRGPAWHNQQVSSVA
jgi:hypothetical protein